MIILLSILIVTLWVQWEWKRIKKEATAKEDVKSKEKPPTPQEDNLAKLVEMMREEREEKAREAKERELAEYALRKKRNQPPAPIQSSLMHEEGPIKGATDYIPYGLSAEEKKILRDFYGEV